MHLWLAVPRVGSVRPVQWVPCSYCFASWLHHPAVEELAIALVERRMRTAKHKVYCGVARDPWLSHPQYCGRRPADHEVTTAHHPRYHQFEPESSVESFLRR